MEFIINRTSLKKCMIENGISRADLSNKLDISYQCLTPKMKGKRGFSENEIAILYSIFGTGIFLPSLATKVVAEERR